MIDMSLVYIVLANLNDFEVFFLVHSATMLDKPVVQIFNVAYVRQLP